MFSGIDALFKPCSPQLAVMDKIRNASRVAPESKGCTCSVYTQIVTRPQPAFTIKAQALQCPPNPYRPRILSPLPPAVGEIYLGIVKTVDPATALLINVSSKRN